MIRRPDTQLFYCEGRGEMDTRERHSEPRYIYDILAEIVAELKPGKDNSIDETRNRDKEHEQQTD